MRLSLTMAAMRRGTDQSEGKPGVRWMGELLIVCPVNI